MLRQDMKKRFPVHAIHIQPNQAAFAFALRGARVAFVFVLRVVFSAAAARGARPLRISRSERSPPDCRCAFAQAGRLP